MTYDELLIEADSIGVTVKELPLQSCDGSCKGKRIAIRKDIPTIKKTAVLAEELGHYYTAVGEILNQKNISNRKQERRGRVWGHEHQIGLDGLVDGFNHGCRNRYELAEYLYVTEEYLEEALEYYRQKYGMLKRYKEYLIRFDSGIGMMRMF